MPKILKKSFQNVLDSACSRDSTAHSFMKAIARVLISFQLSGIMIEFMGVIYSWYYGRYATDKMKIYFAHHI
jgi:hypothetical protein